MRTYCPKCGDTLDGDPDVGCRRGGMPLSAQLLEDIASIVGHDRHLAAPEPLPLRVGGTWFCPACGALAHEPRAGHVECTRCGRSLVGIIHTLTELHPHEKLCVLACTFDGSLSDQDIPTMFLEVLGIRAQQEGDRWRGTAIGGWSFELIGNGETSTTLVARIDRSTDYPKHARYGEPSGFPDMMRSVADAFGLRISTPLAGRRS